MDIVHVYMSIGFTVYANMVSPDFGFKEKPISLSLFNNE